MAIMMGSIYGDEAEASMVEIPRSSVLIVLTVALAACGTESARDLGPTPAPAGEPTGEVRIHVPETLTGIRADVRTADGREVRLRCDSCHGLEGVGDGPPATAEDAGGPHVGLEVAHGDQACGACHAPDRPERLRLADGEVIPMRDALRLCAQCHGPQHRDYRRGSHGGMQGYWDLRRGDRIRNHCVDCHDPHRPAFPRFRPLPPPHDRFPPAPAEERMHE